MRRRLYRHSTISICLAVIASSGIAGPGAAEQLPHAVGTVDFPVSCSAPAQSQFNRAVALLHHMTYPQAREAFRQVVEADPRCAMAHWGIAMTLFQPLWPTRPGLDAREQGWEAVQKAKALGPPTERERMLVAAVEAFFLDPKSADYWPRIGRWEQAMEKAHNAFPRDPEVATFYALALLAAAPPGELSAAHAERAAGVLLEVNQRYPDHPGVMHYMIHANDAPGREHKFMEITRRYDELAPHNPHALHMPTHIYTRVGDWEGVIRGNLRAAEAALDYPAGPDGAYVWDEFPHAIEYLVYAYLQQGADDGAASQIRRLHSTDKLEPTFKTAFHVASTAARYALERRNWREAARLLPRQPAYLDWDRFAWPEAIVHFARGLGAVQLGQLQNAQAARERVQQLEAATSRQGEELFAKNIRVLRLELEAWIAHETDERERSVSLMQEASRLEASTPKHAVTPAPTIPADELLGDLLMEQGRPADALSAYRRSMQLYPRRLNTLLGAARAARAIDDVPAARWFYQELLRLAHAGTRDWAVNEAQRYLDDGLWSRSGSLGLSFLFSWMSIPHAPVRLVLEEDFLSSYRSTEMARKNTVCLWYDGTALDAARFYAETFPDSAVGAVMRAPGDYPDGKQGDVLTVEFTVAGIPCIGLNGGPHFKHNEAFSFQIATDDQAETDRLWNAIVGNGGQESACGWCKDKWGLNWQITPRALIDAISDPDRAAAKRAFEAMMRMSKIDIAAIEAARRG